MFGGFSAEALSVMSAYDWPGNIRELRNVVERAAAFCEETSFNLMTFRVICALDLVWSKAMLRFNVRRSRLDSD